jgi:hypothetical protein
MGLNKCGTRDTEKRVKTALQRKAMSLNKHNVIRQKGREIGIVEGRGKALRRYVTISIEGDDGPAASLLR